MAGDATIPTELDELTAEWFATVLDRDVTAATIIEQSTGTTGRARLELRGAPDVPPTVFVKLAPFGERQRAFVAKTGMGPAEARFYRDLAAEVPVRVPSVWHAATDDDRYVMVLEDLVASGCRFPRTADADIEARVTDIVDQLAALHAAYWESPRFASGADLAWLSARGARSGAGGARFVRMALDTLGDRMGDDFRRLAELYLARTDDIAQLWTRGAGTFVHGDPHLGNLFVDDAAGGRTGFLDWAVLCRAPGVRDVAYVLSNSVPHELRARRERAWLEQYGARLAAAGIVTDPAALWDQYRLFAMYSWVAAASTAGMGSAWQPIEIGIAGTSRATAACAHLDVVGLLATMLG